MGTVWLKTCHRCRYFQGIVYVHPESITHKKDGVPHGYYIKCGNDPYSSIRIPIPHAVCTSSLPNLPSVGYQPLMSFLKINGTCLVECPQKQKEEGRSITTKCNQLSFKFG
jgi:hypothetical protein